MSTSEPLLRIGLVGMSERTRAQLVYWFERSRPRRFAVASSIESPDALLVDADVPGALGALHAARQGPGIPIFALAFGEVDERVSRHATHVLAKPVTGASLHEMAGAIRLARLDGVTDVPGAETDSEVSSEANSETGTPEDLAEPDAAPEAATEASAGPDDALPNPAKVRRRVRNEILCGESGTIEAALRADADGDASLLFHDPSVYLGAIIERELDVPGRDGTAVAPPPSGPIARIASRATRGATVILGDARFFLLPEVDRIYSSVSLRSVAVVERVFRPLSPEDVEIIRHRGDEMPALLGSVHSLALSAYPADGFLWLAALMSSRGRLPLGTDRSRPLKLRHWPNLTRLELPPYSLRMARTWTSGARSIADMVDEAGIEPRFVHAFHNGALALDLFDEVHDR